MSTKQIESKTKVSCLADCSNSPRKEFLRDFNVAFAKGDAPFIIDHVSDDITWVMHGDKTMKGKEAFSAEINVMKDYTADEVVLSSIITHGKEAAVNGEMRMGDKTYAFCDIYLFTSAGSDIIKEMNSYVVMKQS